jgi:hypothetical protein
MVVATRVAKHAATDAIKSAREGRELTYPSGKGSSSIVQAVLEQVGKQTVAA